MSAVGRERIIRLVLLLLNYPYRYGRKDLAKYFDVSSDTIKKDFDLLKTIDLGFEQETKGRYRCAIVPNREFKELHYLLPLTQEEKSRLTQLIKTSFGSNKEADYLINKLESLYDFQKLGLRALRKPKLQLLDTLEQAMREKKCVLLKNYHSNNSNQIRDRRVEPFALNPELDTLQAFDYEREEARHFVLSRVERAQLLDKEPWQHQHRHYVRPTDVFRIVQQEQLRVHLRLDVYAYNSLLENYPQAKACIEPGSEPNTFDFDAKVNAKFYGLLGFLLANGDHVTIYEPPALRAAVRERAEALVKKMGGL